MQISSGGHTYLGSAVAFAHEGRPAVGEEKGENLTPSFAPVDDVSENHRPQNPARNPFASEQQTYEEPTRQQLSEHRKNAHAENIKLEHIQQEVQQMATRDREVRAHEQAHRSVGGQHAGPIMLNLERGPDGINYAVSGEVAINVSAIADDPQASIAKLMQVRRAALAPAEPSAQDRQVAAAAGQKILEAQSQILAQQSSMLQAEQDKNVEFKRSESTENIQHFFSERINESHARDRDLTQVSASSETVSTPQSTKEMSPSHQTANNIVSRLGDQLDINV